MGEPLLKRAKRIAIARAPEYHYVGDPKSYEGTVDMLEKLFSSLHTKYTTIGLHKPINVNAVSFPPIFLKK